MRTIGAALLATTLVASSAFAAGAPLSSGKPAGVKNAQEFGPNLGLYLLGAGVVIGGIALAVSGNKDGVTSPVTSTTGSGLP